MRITYKIQLKTHKQKVKPMNNQTIANNNPDLNSNKKVHLNKISNKNSKNKTLTTTCQSFKNRLKGMIDWYFCNFLSKFIYFYFFYQIFFNDFVFNLFLLDLIIVTIKLNNAECLRWKLNPLLFIQIFTNKTELCTKLNWKFVVQINMHKHLWTITETFKMNR